MLAELERHPHARAVLEPALAPAARPRTRTCSMGPAARASAPPPGRWLPSCSSAGSADPAGARARVASGAHPDLTWVAPSGAHEILVSDIDEPVISAASKTPFEAGCRVFVIERVDELGDEAANRMLKTLEEPASFVHLILLSDRLAEVLPTIRRAASWSASTRRRCARRRRHSRRSVRMRTLRSPARGWRSGTASGPAS